jgi:hypothetical protein
MEARVDKQKWAVLAATKKWVQKLFPDITEESGIYKWERINDIGERCVYIGKAQNILERTAGHITATGSNLSHLEKSIKTHGLLSPDNLTGWRVGILQKCVIKDLNAYETFYIAEWQQQPVKLYNTESGGTVGKKIIGERKERRDILWRQQGYNKAIKEIKECIDKCKRYTAEGKTVMAKRQGEKLDGILRKGEE